MPPKDQYELTSDWYSLLNKSIEELRDIARSSDANKKPLAAYLIEFYDEVVEK